MGIINAKNRMNVGFRGAVILSSTTTTIIIIFVLISLIFFT